MFRDLMKRWRNIFTAHGKEPLFWRITRIPGSTRGSCSAIRAWTARTRRSCPASADWIDSTSKGRFEAIQNARLWGIATFYMPFIAEGGFDNKEKSQFPRWQWRMGRQAQSEFAHYETATVYQGQGSQVYKGFWQDALRWGARDPAACSFHPYWDDSRFLRWMTREATRWCLSTESRGGPRHRQQPAEAGSDVAYRARSAGARPARGAGGQFRGLDLRPAGG